ncbi:MAG TPA: sialidase family protein [Acidimicrobiales bacterium]|nr:sialidase family protein [Acidimicrobiales bacterium]
MAAPPKGPPLVGPAIQVTPEIDPSRAYNQPQVVVDPKDPLTVAIVGANYNAGTCGVHVSLDGGRTWRAGKGVAKPADDKTCVRSDSGPYLDGAFANGTIYLASASDDFGGQQDVNNLYLSRSTDLGDTWETTIAHKGGTAVEFTEVNGTKKIGGEHFSLVRMGIDQNNPNYVYVGGRLGHADRTPPYGLFGNVSLRAVIVASEDGGKTWGPMVDLLDGLPRAEYAGSRLPSITVGNDGTVYAFHRERTAPNDPAKPANAQSAPGSPGAGGRLFLSTSTDHGKSWTTKSIDDSGVPCTACTADPEGVYNPKTGELYVVFGQRDNADAEQNVWIKRSTDGGRTFGPSIRVNHDATPRDHQYPQVSVAPNGRVDVAWHDWRNDTLFNPGGTRSNALYWDVYYSHSNDGGLTWADDMRMSDRSMHRNEGYSFHNNYGLGGPVGIASTDAAALVAWGDSRRGSVPLPVEDYYFASAVYDRSALEASGGGESHTARDVALGSVITLVVAGLVLVFAAAAGRRGQPKPAPAPSKAGAT